MHLKSWFVANTKKGSSYVNINFMCIIFIRISLKFKNTGNESLRNIWLSEKIFILLIFILFHWNIQVRESSYNLTPTAYSPYDSIDKSSLSNWLCNFPFLRKIMDFKFTHKTHTHTHTHTQKHLILTCTECAKNCTWSNMIL